MEQFLDQIARTLPFPLDVIVAVAGTLLAQHLRAKLGKKGPAVDPTGPPPARPTPGPDRTPPPLPTLPRFPRLEDFLRRARESVAVGDLHPEYLTSLRDECAAALEARQPRP